MHPQKMGETNPEKQFVVTVTLHYIRQSLWVWFARLDIPASLRSLKVPFLASKASLDSKKSIQRCWTLNMTGFCRINARSRLQISLTWRPLKMSKRSLSPSPGGALVKRAKATPPPSNQIAISSTNDNRNKGLIRTVQRTSNLEAPIVSLAGAHSVYFTIWFYIIYIWTTRYIGRNFEL